MSFHHDPFTILTIQQHSDGTKVNITNVTETANDYRGSIVGTEGRTLTLTFSKQDWKLADGER